jgi:uncharacterized protein YkwD
MKKMKIPPKIKLLRYDKPFLLSCLGLLAIICVFLNSNHQTIAIRPTVAEQILYEINQHRISKGLTALMMDERLTEIARKHSLRMAAGVVPVGHTDSNERFAAITQLGINWTAAAENVACVNRFKDPASESLHYWLNSKIGQQNIKGNFNRTGIAVIRNKNKGDYYITQIYLKTP